MTRTRFTRLPPKDPAALAWAAVSAAVRTQAVEAVSVEVDGGGWAVAILAADDSVLTTVLVRPDGTVKTRGVARALADKPAAMVDRNRRR